MRQATTDDRNPPEHPDPEHLRSEDTEEGRSDDASAAITAARESEPQLVGELTAIEQRAAGLGGVVVVDESYWKEEA